MSALAFLDFSPVSSSFESILETVITSQAQRFSEYLSKVFRYRYLIATLIMRDLKIRYAQTALGWLWAVAQPLAGVAVFSFFFTYIIQMDTGDVPYPLVALSGMVAWNYFSFVVNQGSTSLIASQALIKKISFPKISLVIAKSIAGLSDMLVALLILLIWAWVAGRSPELRMLLLPVIILCNWMTGLALAIWLSALTVRWRDLQHLIPYLITFGIWVTPVFYPTTIVPEQFSFLVYLNPMAGVIEMLRYSMLGTALPDPGYLLGLVAALFLLLTGLWYFKKIETLIPDYI
jgi:lipopolysaccharide transport system permease protein